MLTHLRPGTRGLTLIELMIVVAVIALGTALALPGLRTWTANAQMRSSATALQASLKLAQSEAVRSFRQVVFFRTSDTTCSPNATADAAGARWIVKVLPLTTGGTALATQCGVMLDNAENFTVTGPTAVCFGANGRPLQLTTSQTGVGAACSSGTNGRIIYGLAPTVTTANLKQLQVWLTLGGSVRTCEKTRQLSDTVLDGCPEINLAPTS
ncbi:pilus assembly FimT family protein [Roseateles sp. So40a]|uniref:pilus assembly FimT family protein n=1 Tax=Roseateles sp. So40a TaxID=3400226 RepID=UPI003A876B1F